MIRVFDFRCADGHVHEHFVQGDTERLACTTCGGDAIRLMPATRSRLEGFSGAFPTAADKWVNDRASKQAADDRSVERHGETRNGHKPGTFLGDTFKAKPAVLK